MVIATKLYLRTTAHPILHHKDSGESNLGPLTLATSALTTEPQLSPSHPDILSPAIDMQLYILVLKECAGVTK